MTKLKLLVSIFEHKYEKRLEELLNKNNVIFKLVTHGNGTASSSMLNYFGLTETKKIVNISLIPDYIEEKILKQINRTLNIESRGKGISFTIPLTSANKFLLEGFDDIETKKEQDMEKTKYHLIITIVLEGFLEQVMTSAKKMGAHGGTVIRGRGIGNNSAVKLFGFEIEPGREVVLTVVEDEIKNKVMEEITKNVGINTKGKGICISLPVDSAIGIEK